MKVLLLFPLAALVMALALPVPSKPLWTVEMRLSGASAANRSVTDALGLPGEVTLLDSAIPCVPPHCPSCVPVSRSPSKQ